MEGETSKEELPKVPLVRICADSEGAIVARLPPRAFKGRAPWPFAAFGCGVVGDDSGDNGAEDALDD